MESKYLITGASSDIATEYLMYLNNKENGSIVLCQYHTNKEVIYNLSKNLKNIKIIPYEVDLSSCKDTQEWIDRIVEDGYDPDHILHIAAEPLDFKRFVDYEWDELSRNLLIQVDSFGQILREFLPKMGKKRFGKVVVVLSACVLGVPPKYMLDYTVTKYALLGMMKSAASDYGEKNININGISPNMMETKFLNNLEERQLEIMKRGTTKKRNVKIDEVVQSIDFLMSNASDYMSGVNLNLTGGDRM